MKAPGTHYRQIESDAICIATRFVLRSAWMLPFAWWAARKVTKATRRNVPGLIDALFLIEGPRVFHSVSIWQDAAALRQFNMQQIHVDAANMATAWIRRAPGERPEMCTLQWGLVAISDNRFWKDVDWTRVIKRDRT